MKGRFPLEVMAENSPIRESLGAIGAREWLSESINVEGRKRERGIDEGKATRPTIRSRRRKAKQSAPPAVELRVEDLKRKTSAPTVEADSTNVRPGRRVVGS